MVTIHRVEGYCTNQVAEQTRSRFLSFSPFDGCDPSQRRDHYDAARVAAGRVACKQERAVVSPFTAGQPVRRHGSRPSPHVNRIRCRDRALHGCEQRLLSGPRATCARRACCAEAGPAPQRVRAGARSARAVGLRGSGRRRGGGRCGCVCGCGSAHAGALHAAGHENS
jgi:hypothetical protein